MNDEPEVLRRRKLEPPIIRAVERAKEAITTLMKHLAALNDLLNECEEAEVECPIDTDFVLKVEDLKNVLDAFYEKITALPAREEDAA